MQYDYPSIYLPYLAHYHHSNTLVCLDCSLHELCVDWKGYIKYLSVNMPLGVYQVFIMNLVYSLQFVLHTDTNVYSLYVYVSPKVRICHVMIISITV